MFLLPCITDMLPEFQIPPPFLINTFKHHIGYAYSLLEGYEAEDEPMLIKEFKKGNNLLCDYYIGKLSPPEICRQASQRLEELNVLNREACKAWIMATPKHYRNIVLNDSSTWTVLMGRSNQRYIHLHPARYSKHAFRVRFLALKTALLYRLYFMANDNWIDYDVINLLRHKMLSAPPIKKGGDVHQIKRVLNMFC